MNFHTLRPELIFQKLKSSYSRNQYGQSSRLNRRSNSTTVSNSRVKCLNSWLLRVCLRTNRTRPNCVQQTTNCHITMVSPPRSPPPPDQQAGRPPNQQAGRPTNGHIMINPANFPPLRPICSRCATVFVTLALRDAHMLTCNPAPPVPGNGEILHPSGRIYGVHYRPGHSDRTT